MGALSMISISLAIGWFELERFQVRSVDLTTLTGGSRKQSISEWIAIG
jgi:hypothetical protein